ncbi:hypothetical protein Tcan_07816 [Toxocara canis]|uniref:Uncharacterized protein n=1 Tax=Toxocara canis TaxID=6265 RepID=A0A0B2W0V5_TOXCA|nr:hypothetical protein Tcan_07816 [Toxocara canis]
MKIEVSWSLCCCVRVELALPAIRAQIELIDKVRSIVGDEPSTVLVHELTILGHELADLIVCSAAAAYTVSIQHFEQLALPAIRAQIELIDKVRSIVGDEPSTVLVHELTILGHELADLIVCSAAAAYTVSIQHFEPVNEQCRVVATEAVRAVKTLKELRFAEIRDTVLPTLKVRLFCRIYITEKIYWNV